MNPSDLTQWLLGLLLGSIGGAVGTIVALRTRFAMMKRDIQDEQKARERLAREVNARVDHITSNLDERLDRVEKRQLLALRMTADIARKVQVDARLFDDALVRMLSEDP